MFEYYITLFWKNIRGAFTGYLSSPGYTPDNLPESLAKRILSLNDLTLDHLKIRAKELESSLNECKSRIAEKQTSIIQQETELATVKFKSDPVSIQRMFTVKKTMDALKKDVNELRCVEQKLSRQLELIQKPLNELGMCSSQLTR